MRDKLAEELQKIEIPEGLHERAISGVKAAKAEKLKKKRLYPIVVTAAVLTISFASLPVAFPTIASQIPFMDHIVSYFSDEELRYQNFEEFSTEVGLTQTSNDITVLIDNAVYDGTNITVSFAIQTDHMMPDQEMLSAGNWFDVKDTTGIGGVHQITQVTDNQFVGLASFTPDFKEGQSPESVDISWEPEAFYGVSNDFSAEGNWAFDFSLTRVEGNTELLNETVQHEHVNFTLKSIELTDVSTVIHYEQSVSEELLKEWESVTPAFNITDDLGHSYVSTGGGGGKTTDDYSTFTGTTDFGTVQPEASQLIIQPVQIASLQSGEGLTEIEMKPIVIDLGSLN